jgi:hypothetical protein
LVAGIIAYSLGARGAVLLFAVVLIFFPVAMIVSSISRRLVPPTLTFGDDWSSHLRDS